MKIGKRSETQPIPTFFTQTPDLASRHEIELLEQDPALLRNRRSRQKSWRKKVITIVSISDVSHQCRNYFRR
jgi:hypothetical protein